MDVAINEAENNVDERQKEIFEEVCGSVFERRFALQEMCFAVSKLDCAVTAAVLARERAYVRPDIVSSMSILNVEGGRHPVVELRKDMNVNFTANDCVMNSEKQMQILTGPNMSGKSTFLRQQALLVLMAQAGLWVPARRMELSPVDRIFTRVGSSDDIMRNQSTFMVEMKQVNNILQHATKSSLVIMDEVGRGTANADGVALAIAILEHLHDEIQCRTLFATHFKECTQMETLVRNENRTMRVDCIDGNIVFSHKIISGVASQSYGILCGEIAGLPRSVISRAYHLCSNMVS